MNKIISILFACLMHATLAVASAYNLRVEVTPDGAGTLNTSSGTYEQGASVYLRTYSNTGFVFKGWYDGETLLSSSTSFNYTMPARNAVVQARYEYDPTVPANPAMPDTTKYYAFTADVSPEGAGTLNIYSGKYAAGANVSLRAYLNTGYRFAGWQNDKGETLSTSTSYSYKMPQSDAHLTALYYYDPDVPANPDTMGIRRTVTVECKPVGGGTFNTSNTTAVAGSSVHLYSYTNTGYKFLYWESEDGDTLSVAQNFYYNVPDRNSKVYGVFEYDPEVPGNPNKNYWNKELGELIVDDFTVGQLSSAASQAISGSSNGDVAMIIVAGRMNDNDFGVANNYSNCTLLDLSRVTGITEVPSYAFDYTNLESVYLPAIIENIGYRAFYDCKRLSSLTIYSMTPPTLENYVFDGVPEGLVVYVPAAVITQYQEAEGWKDFTFLPIQEDIRSLTVNMPQGTNAADYKQMWLELTNVKSGQRLHYILTDRTVYTFPNLIRNTTWNVQLRNEAGDVFGKIENVDVKDEDVTVTFAALQKPQNISLKVLTPAGEDITSQVQVTWTDADGKYLSQQTALTGLIEGKQLSYRLSLPQSAAMLYLTPDVTEYTVKNGDNNVVCTLTDIPQLVIEGKVLDAADGRPLSGATVGASQTFAGMYSNVVNVRTDATGAYKLQLLNTSTVVSVSASDYISQSIVCDTLIAGVDNLRLPDTKLKAISGAVLNINFTYTESTEEGAEAETVNWYNDYNNVIYTIYNKTKNSAVTQFNVQYPQIVLLEEVDEGDQLQVTATSINASFVPVECIATVTNQNADFTFDILELGKIAANFQKTTNTEVVAILYNADGKLIKSYEYSNAALTISNLADGKYILVSMGGSQIFNTIYDLSKFAQSGLTLGSDYVQQSVEVKSGTVSKITFEEVPLFDESKFYYTGSGTSFTVNKTSIVSGNYLTLTGKVDFKQEYAGKVGNVSLVVDLPAECSFVENSVMVGNSTGSYILEGNRLTIPMARYTDRVRFCVIPTRGGDYAPSAFVSFDLNGKSINQPIGAANYTAKDLSISVPKTVARSKFTISGTAIGRSIIEIFDNGIKIGETTSLANGAWSTTCELSEPENLSIHNIYAKVTTSQGLELQSETLECLYDINAVEVSKVTMINVAHPANSLNLGEYVTVFDFMNPSKQIPAYWYWPQYPEFTFLIEINYHDRKLIPFVWLHVYTTDGNVRSLRANYNEEKDLWIVIDDFTSSALPCKVSVTVENMVFDLASEVSYKNLLDEYVGDIQLKEIEETDDNKTNLHYTDKDGNDLATITTYETDLSTDEVVDSLKKEGFKDDENLNNVSDYIPEDEDDSVGEDLKVYADYDKGSLAFVSGGIRTKVVIIRIIREEGKTSTTELISSTITRQWKQFFRTYFDPVACAQVTEYKKYTEYLEEYVKITTSSLIAYTVFINVKLLPPSITKIPAKQVIAKIRRIRHYTKRYTTYTMEYSIIPKDCLPPPPPPPPSITPPVDVVMDPSGYVYEGVSSNRVEGATATVYYKEMVEDMYGDLHENIVKWDAEEYAQKNPLFTDENGMYAWDVPQGLWQVKFEKEGYETTYSEWLPVPPPQLEVNIAMKQNVQPNVETARAFEDAIEVKFDKYMMPELLNTDNIVVTADGNVVEGTVELLDEEVSYEGFSDKYASKLRFNAKEPFPTKEVTLLVKNRVKSYAGIRMQDDYSQSFAVELEVRKIDCDSTVTVIYGEDNSMLVKVLPAAAAAGKTLNVKALSSMILTVDAASVVLDENGCAEIVMSGELPGTSALLFDVEGYDVSATMVVNVKTREAVVTATPKASIASGAEVDKGTELYLSCDTEGATIYYTLDGSCPCDNTDARKVYDGTPIIINETVTIKAMAMAPDMYESDVAEFTYIVDDADTGIDDITINGQIQIYPLPVRDKVNISASGKIIKSVTISSLNGIAVISTNKHATKVTLDVSRIPAGIYIINVTTADSTLSRKILKLD